MDSNQQLSTYTEGAARPADLVYDGLHVQLQPTPFWLRVLALTVDYGCIYTSMFAVLLVLVFAFFGMTFSLSYLSAVMQFEPDTAISILAVVLVLVLLAGILLLTHGYFLYFEYKKQGQTPGKKLFGLRVVTTDGSPLSLGKCLIRETMRYVDLMLVLPGLLSWLLTQKRQRLGDVLAGTMVAYSRYEARETDYLYVKQSDYRYLLEILRPQPVPQTTVEQFLSFAYKEFIRARPHTPASRVEWEQVARQYVPQATGLDQLTILLFFAEYCYQTSNRQQP
jgi:uncharacterized RDD family membrane protein YckC